MVDKKHTQFALILREVFNDVLRNTETLFDHSFQVAFRVKTIENVVKIRLSQLNCTIQCKFSKTCKNELNLVYI